MLNRRWGKITHITMRNNKEDPRIRTKHAPSMGKESQTATNNIWIGKSWPPCSPPVRWSLLRSWLPETVCVPWFRKSMKTLIRYRGHQQKNGHATSGFKKRSATASIFFLLSQSRQRTWHRIQEFFPNNRSYSRVENCGHPLEEGANLDSRDQWRYYASIWKRRQMHCPTILKRSPHHPRGYCLTAADFICSTRVEKRPTIEIELLLIMFCSFLFQRQVWFQIRFMIFMIAHLDGFI